jgi:plasmid maintenance system antidote protein VapI
LLVPPNLMKPRGLDASITPEMTLKLEISLGSTAETWMAMQVNYELAELRTSGLSVWRRLTFEHGLFS